MKQREANYDLLRIASAFAVVFGHVSASFVETYIWDYFDGVPVNHPLVSCLFTTLPRFSVPVFLMMSGAFLLADVRTKDWRSFYRKALHRISGPAIAAIVFAVIYNFITLVLIDKESIMSVIQPLLNGAPFYHLWYLPTLFISYLSAPFLYMFKEAVGEKCFHRFSIALLVLGCYALWQNSPVTMHWNIGEAVCLLGFFTAGYTLREASKGKHGGILLVIAGFAVECVVGYLYYKRLALGLDRTLAEHELIVSYAPATVLASALIYSGVVRMKISGNLAKPASYTYAIYLIHAFVLDLILRLSRHFFGQRWLTHLNAWVAIPVLSLLVFGISYLAGVGIRAGNRAFAKRKA